MSGVCIGISLGCGDELHFGLMELWCSTRLIGWKAGCLGPGTFLRIALYSVFLVECGGW